MAVETIRELVELLDANEPRKALDAARRLRDSVGTTQSPRANNIRLYCTIVESLCSIKLTGTSSQIATSLIGASHHALVLKNPHLSMLALWYVVCCRMMHLYSLDAGDNVRPYENLDTEIKLLSARATQLRNLDFTAVAATMAAEYSLRINAPEATIRAALKQARAKVHAVAAKTSRVILCEAFLAGVHEADGHLPRKNVDHDFMLYVPGELAETFK